jgi:hypothetical protein
MAFTCALVRVGWQAVATANEQVWLSSSDRISGSDRTNQQSGIASKNKEWD